MAIKRIDKIIRELFSGINTEYHIIRKNDNTLIEIKAKSWRGVCLN